MTRPPICGSSPIGSTLLMGKLRLCVYAQDLDPPKCDGGPRVPVGAHQPHKIGLSLLTDLVIVQRLAGVFCTLAGLVTTGSGFSSGCSTSAGAGSLASAWGLRLKARMTRGTKASAATRISIPPRLRATGNTRSGYHAGGFQLRERGRRSTISQAPVFVRGCIWKGHFRKESPTESGFGRARHLLGRVCQG